MPVVVDRVSDELRDWETITLTTKQDDFIFSPAKIAAYGGGVGNGKSFAGCIKIDNHCQDNPGAFVLIGRRHATDLMDSTLQDFISLFGDHGIYKDKSRKFIYPNGSEVIFRHLDDLRSLTNMNLSYFWIDQAEEVPEDAFIFLMGRIRRMKGLTGKPISERGGALTFNMEGHNWIWRRLLKHLDKNGDELPRPQDYHLVTATSLENPHLPKDYVEGILSMPKEWVDRFVHGSWDDNAGQIFSDFSQSIHVVDPFPVPNHWERFRSIDHGQNNPTSCHWYAVDYDGNIFAYQEYYKPDAPVSEHVKNIIQRSYVPTTSGKKVLDDYNYTVIDPSTHAKTRERDGVKFSVADEYYEAGIHTLPAQNDVLAGINRCREYLRVDPNRYHPQKTMPDGTPFKGAPRFFIFRGRCPNLEEEILGYKWKPIKYGTESNNPDQPVKKDDHAVDDWRYALMSRPISPTFVHHIDPMILRDPLRLAKYAQKEGLTVNDFLVQRLTNDGNQGIKHATSGVTHQEGGIAHRYVE